MSETLQKPVPVTRQTLDYSNIIDFIEQKYEIKTSDYLGMFKDNKYNPDVEYLDFWHWMIENQFPYVQNDSTEYWNINGVLNDTSTPEWVREITQKVKDEFGEYLDENGGFKVDISW